MGTETREHNHNGLKSRTFVLNQDEGGATKDANYALNVRMLTGAGRDFTVTKEVRQPAIHVGRSQPSETPVISRPRAITTAAEATGIQRKNGLPPALLSGSKCLA